MNSQQIKDVLNYLSKNGIAFGNGNHYFTQDQVIEYIKDADACMAKIYGVPKYVYILWRDHVDITCSAKNSKGKPCKNVILRSTPYEPHNQFTYMETLNLGGYCHVHDKR